MSNHICDICNARLANYEFYENINGIETSRHICQVCFEKIKSSYNQKTYYQNDYYDNYNKNLEIKNAVIKKCPVCKMSEDEILETGYAGCSNCYKVFSVVLDPMIEKVQETNQHNGKTPFIKKNLNNDLSKDLEKLIAERTRAISEERYEDSQKLTDKINELRKEEKNK